MKSVLWFRGRDLRLRNHMALRAALEGGEVVAVYVLSPSETSKIAFERVPHRTHYLLHALSDLASSIEALGSKLVLLEGESPTAISRLVKRGAFDQVITQSSVIPAEIERLAAVKERLEVPVLQVDGETLLRPGAVLTGSGEPYSVFTPFARAARRLVQVSRPMGAPRSMPPVDARLLAKQPRIEELPAWKSAQKLTAREAGERAGLKRLRRFIDTAASDYESGRDILGSDGTSRLSADLRFGAVTTAQVWYAVSTSLPECASRERFLTQLLWREFAYSTLAARPQLLREPFQKKFGGFPWRDDAPSFQAWCEGRTGYPVVDAAARQLLSEGYVHNRARMIAASFLSKNLLVDFRRGEEHYLGHLTDGDEAINDLGWQWASGTGCDAQPYYRVFNPILQGEKFDPEGRYVRRYLPELRNLPNRFIHRPWEAPRGELNRAGISLGNDYPTPIVDLRASRNRYLAICSEFFGDKPPPDERG